MKITIVTVLSRDCHRPENPAEKQAEKPVSSDEASTIEIAKKQDVLEPFGTLWDGGNVVESRGTGKTRKRGNTKSYSKSPKFRKFNGFSPEKRKKESRLRDFLVEVTTRFELVNDGFADRCLTTWLRHRMNLRGERRNGKGGSNRFRPLPVRNARWSG